MPSNFYEYMTKHMQRKNNPVGDLAKDMQADKSWPTSGDNVVSLHDHLRAKGACREAHEALDMGWSLFNKCENKHWYWNDEIEVNTPIAVRNQVTASTRFNILKRDGYCCRICGRGKDDGVKLEVDHKVARANGGSNRDDNLWTLCFECNRGKRTASL